MVSFTALTLKMNEEVFQRIEGATEVKFMGMLFLSDHKLTVKILTDFLREIWVVLVKAFHDAVYYFTFAFIATPPPPHSPITHICSHSILFGDLYGRSERSLESYW